ncbi:hypothetical protein RvY_17319 [Ramazzottius varieornatus]|uniref:Uncharacterized protein n=1 Tax=Ramazzottius varieornatus TaxID=947166 RepID=A0A1D1W1R4_RAMVA|nr:hypothetical protein RvY_17319 [Ramazzottius varieornatus]
MAVYDPSASTCSMSSLRSRLREDKRDGPYPLQPLRSTSSLHDQFKPHLNQTQEDTSVWKKNFI